MKTIRYFLFGLAIALGLAVVVGASVLTRGYTYHGSLIDPPLAIADFQLTGKDAQPASFSQVRGGEGRNIVLIFFGYTRCPDVCPVTLAHFKKIKTQLKQQASQVRFVFISVDPESDTPAVVDKYLANFDPEFIGLTGTREELEPVWKIFGVYQEKQDTGSTAGYQVSHSSRIYAIDWNGQLRLTYAFGTDPDVIAQDVTHLLNDKRVVKRDK